MNRLLAISIIIILVSCTGTKKNSYDKNALVSVNIRSRELTALPDSVFNKVGLTHLFAGINGWVAITPFGIIENPPNHNQIHYLPERLCTVKTLKVLDLQFNNIDTLPACFVKLQNLESLDLSYNNALNVRQCIPIITQLKKLKELRLHLVSQALLDTAWVHKQFEDRDIKLAITTEDMLRYYGRHE